MSLFFNRNLYRKLSPGTSAIALVAAISFPVGGAASAKATAFGSPLSGGQERQVGLNVPQNMGDYPTGEGMDGQMCDMTALGSLFVENEIPPHAVARLRSELTHRTCESVPGGHSET
ncbi:hypothetical protein [Pasteuria penetrans]|uniref:hypothetical protein n=1 Tax=Pasteuria penetrans TaxID=86005 RepID=UPI000F996BC7|nr:hypothetical protein [Pasteuria penetrans]